MGLRLGSRTLPTFSTLALTDLGRLALSCKGLTQRIIRYLRHDARSIEIDDDEAMDTAKGKKTRTSSRFSFRSGAGRKALSQLARLCPGHGCMWDRLHCVCVLCFGLILGAGCSDFQLRELRVQAIGLCLVVNSGMLGRKQNGHIWKRWMSYPALSVCLPPPPNKTVCCAISRWIEADALAPRLSAAAMRVPQKTGCSRARGAQTKLWACWTEFGSWLGTDNDGGLVRNIGCTGGATHPDQLFARAAHAGGAG